MPLQRESDTEPDDVETDLPVVIPKYHVSQSKLDHLARARQRKAELALERAGERAKQKEETIALTRGVKQIKDPISKEVVKKEILKATALRQPRPLSAPAISIPNELKEPPVAKKQPKVVLEESEPEVIYVKVPKKRIVVEQSETEEEQPKKPKTARRTARKARPVETESEYESEYDYPPPPPAPRRLIPQPSQFKINFQY
jgi:hypothetical protein